jgi:hypothetical protein
VTNSNLHSILMPWITVRKVKVDVEVVSVHPLFFFLFLFLNGPIAFAENSRNPL